MGLTYVIRIDCDGVDGRWCGESRVTGPARRPDVVGARAAVRAAGWRVTPYKTPYGTRYRFQCPKCAADAADWPYAREVDAHYQDRPYVIPPTAER